MAWYLFLISFTILGFSNAVLTKRSNNDQPQFQQYEIQSFGTASSNPVSNILNAISTPLNVLADRLNRHPIAQQFNAGLNSQRRPPPFQYGPPGHHGHHHGPHEHHHHHEQQENNQFQYPKPPVPPFLGYLPSAQNSNREAMNINPQNPFLNSRQPQDPQYPQRPNFFQFAQNYPKPGFSNVPAYTFPNTNDNNNFGNNGCIGFCQPPQTYENNGFNNRPNNGQANNGFLTPNQPSLQGTGLIHSTFGGFGNDISQTQQPQPTQNPFTNGGFNNNNFGNTFNKPQVNNNGFGTPNIQSQGNDLIHGSFEGFGSNDNRTPPPQVQPQPQENNFPTNQVDQTKPSTTNTPSEGNGLIQGVFGGFGTPQNPQTNNNNNNGNTAQVQKPSDGNDLIQGVFGGFGTPQNPQTNNGNTAQVQTPSDGNDLIQGVFGGFGTPQNPQQTNNNNGNTAQVQTPSDGNDLIQGVFGGFGTPQNPQQTNNNNNGNTAQVQVPSDGNDLIQGVFGGFGTSSTNSGNNFQPTTEISPQSKDNNDLIQSVFSGISNNKEQDGTRTTTIPPTTTNSNGLIYDIDVRSS